MPCIFWLVLSSMVNYTITFSQPCLWALCPSCALPASLKGLFPSNTHVMVVFIRAGNEKCKFSQGTLQERVFPSTFCSLLAHGELHWLLSQPQLPSVPQKWPNRGSAQEIPIILSSLRYWKHSIYCWNSFGRKAKVI